MLITVFIIFTIYLSAFSQDFSDPLSPFVNDFADLFNPEAEARIALELRRRHQQSDTETTA